MNRRNFIRIASTIPFVSQLHSLFAQAPIDPVPTWEQVTDLIKREAARGYTRAYLIVDCGVGFTLRTYSGPSSNIWTYIGAGRWALSDGRWALKVEDPQTRYTEERYK
jgi:hypothetical protein